MRKGLLLLFVLLGAIGLRAQDATVVGDTLVSDTTCISLDKTYIIGERSKRYVISYTATNDGYLSINSTGQKISTNARNRNGAGLYAGSTSAKFPYEGSYTQDSKTGSLTGIPMAKGDVFTCQVYTNTAPSAEKTYSIQASFAEGANPLTLTAAYPVDGSEWSGAVEYKSYGGNGVAFYTFSSLLDIESVVASVKIGETVFSPVGIEVQNYYSYMSVKGLADTLKVAAAEGLISAGDQFTVTLSGLKDRVFSDVVLEDQTFTYTMGNTSCTGVTPSAITSLTVDNIQEAIFHFDGKVNIDKAKFYLLSLVDSSKVELTATVDGVDLVIPVASAVEGIMPRLFDIIAEGVTDAKGNALTYSSKAADAEEGKLKIHYSMNLTPFAPVAVPAQNDTVFSLKTFTLTYPVDVIYNAKVATSEEVKLTRNYGETLVSAATLAVSETDPKVVTITLAEEIKTPGEYLLEVPDKLLWANEAGYNPEDLSTKGSAKYGYYQASINWKYYITPFEPKSSSPAAGSTVNKLDKVTLAFSEEVNVNYDCSVAAIVSAEMGVAPDTIAVGEITGDFLDYTMVNITLDKALDSLGNYRLVIPAGAIFATADETRVTSELSYEFSVDPDYWDPEWVTSVSGTSQEAPVVVIPGRKYEFSDMNTYITYTATEDGRLYFTPLTDHWVDLSRCDETWYNNGDLQKNAEGLSWTGVEAGQTVYLTDYMIGAKRQYLVTFEAGEPFEKLEYTGTFPVAGGQYSASVEGPESWEYGAVEFYFSTKVDADDLGVYIVLPSLNNKEIDLSGDAQIVQGAIEYGETPAYVAVILGDLINEIKESNGLKAGDKIQVILKNVHDINFESNKLDAEPMVELTLAATVCTSVYPNTEYSVETMPTELSLRFDGNVTCVNGKGRIIDVKSGDVQEFAIENFECKYVEAWTAYYEGVITLPALEKELTGKQFRIEIEGLVDDEGNTISYGEEIGKFVLDYRFSDAAFNYVSADPEDGSELASIKSTRLTFDDEVHIGPNAYAYFYYGDYEEVTGEFAYDPNDPKSVVITWSQEITVPGRYNINIEEGSIYDGGYDETKDDLGLADGAYYNPGIYLEYLIPADLSATTVATISPEPYNFMTGAVEKLPAEAVVEFEGNVKEILSVTGVASVGGGWAMAYEEGEEPVASALAYTLNGNALTITLPAEEVASMSYGSYTITVNAIGEDGKPIGYALDSWGDLDQFGDYISFSYQVQKLLKVTECTPADFSTVKELSSVTLTFSEELDAYGTWSDTPCLLNANDDSKVADFTYTLSGNQLILTLAEPVTALGSYAVYIPAYALSSVTGLENDNDIYVFVDVDPSYVAEEDLAIVSATPENGASVATLTQVEFKLNKEVGYLDVSMLIGDNGEDAHGATLVQSAEDPTAYTLDFTYDGLFENVELKKGVTYTMTLTSWASEEACNYGQGKSETVTLTYVGDAEAFQYSDVTLESITPAEDFVISDKSQNKFVVKFSGAVEMVESLTYVNMGQGATQTFESIVASDDKTEYTLTIAEDVLATIRNTVNIVFAANDLNGKRVQGTNGENEYSTFAYFYTTTIGVPALTVTPDAAVEQASIAAVSISCADGLVPSWTAGNITLTDANGNAIALNDPEAVVAEGASEWATPTEWTVALKEELTAIGTYTLTIPAGYFNIGSTQGQIMGSKQTVVVFNITEAAKNAAGIKGVTADVDVVVYNVAGVAVANGKASEVLKNLTKGLYIVNGKKYVVK